MHAGSDTFWPELSDPLVDRRTGDTEPFAGLSGRGFHQQHRQTLFRVAASPEQPLDITTKAQPFGERIGTVICRKIQGAEEVEMLVRTNKGREPGAYDALKVGLE